MFFKDVRFPKQSKSWNGHRNILHASDPAIRPYMTEHRGVCRFLGGGDFAVFYSLYICYRPCLGSPAGVTCLNLSVFKHLNMCFGQPRLPASEQELVVSQIHAFGIRWRATALSRRIEKGKACRAYTCRCLLAVMLVITLEEARMIFH